MIHPTARIARSMPNRIQGQQLAGQTHCRQISSCDSGVRSRCHVKGVSHPVGSLPANTARINLARSPCSNTLLNRLCRGQVHFSCFVCWCWHRLFKLSVSASQRPCRSTLAFSSIVDLHCAKVSQCFCLRSGPFVFTLRQFSVCWFNAFTV